jgi:hypothetical protein
MQGSDTMKPWLLIILGVALPAIAGCRTDPNIAYLERDNYNKDREIRRLQGQIEDLQGAMNSSEDRPSSRRRVDDDPEPRSSKHRGRHISDEPSDGSPPVIEMPGRPADKVPDALKHPPGSIPTDIPEVPEGIRGPSSNRSSDEGPSLEGGPERTRSRPVSMSSAAPIRPAGDSSRVASIVLDRAMTGGIGSDDRSGDQGLLVVIEPRDASGRVVDAPAAVNVAVLDPAYQGEAARVARWNFTAAETAALFRRTNSGVAIHLAMGWPDSPPKHNKLHLFVRYLTADRRTIEVNQPIEIALPGDRTARWTPAEAPSVDSSTARDSSPSAWRPNETAPVRAAGTTPYIATRSSASNPERPMWSPDRR